MNLVIGKTEYEALNRCPIHGLYVPPNVEGNAEDPFVCYSATGSHTFHWEN